MARFTFDVRTVPRDQIPTDRPLGEGIAARLSDPARPPRGVAALVLRRAGLEEVDLAAVRRAGMPLPWFVSSLTTTATDGGAAEVVGIAGRVTRHRPGGDVPVALVFLEWADNRWWHWEALLDASGAVRPDTATVRDALDGDPMPQGLGRWWAAARRAGMRARMERTVH